MGGQTLLLAVVSTTLILALQTQNVTAKKLRKYEMKIRTNRDYILYKYYVGSCLIAIRYLANYVHVCKRSDPQLEKCLIKTIESFRPELPNGELKIVEIVF